MNRAHNFNPGPAALPLEVLQRVQAELLDFAGTGMSILEISHRSKDYEAVHNAAQQLLRELLGIPEQYHILFLGGGASLQFSMVPMNLLGPGVSADYIITGAWSQKAWKEAKLVGSPRIAATTEVDGKFTRIPKQEELDLDPNARFVHITSNNTIFGTQWHTFPHTGSVPIVADMSSDLLWRPFDIRPFGLIYGGAQKNLGPAGVTVVIIREDLLAASREDIPIILRYKTHAKENSLYNTPPVFAIYIVKLVLEWIKERGGLSWMEQENRAKAARIYGVIDAFPEFYRAPVEKDSRSFMNAVFRLPSEELEAKFLEEAKKRRFVGLKGHRSVGGMRVSMYNFVPRASIEELAVFMEDFAKKNA
ncbi:MAG: 3-phosphoserine/phosphohydroxythreonine transaminase [Thermoanaerobaculum sp.]|nr:3-phosphoserine/phosphohydroxythreonine transaminase [Thermoanaerobaculum sp.]MDW7968503.1 3-phosphoserine/phosphohydroxythreonine transaminase [Thermoanaerobaculum sp.]